MKISVDMEWNTDENTPDEHLDALKESAFERVSQMLPEGYVAGELIDNIHMLDDDPEDGVEYRGWWSLSVDKTVEPETH